MILDPVACMNVWSLTLMFVCMMHTLSILIQVAMMHICMMHLSTMLDPDTCVYDAQSNDPGPWSWSVYDASMYDSGPWSWMYDACNNASFSRICVYMMLPDACMHDAYIYYSWPFTLMHVCMMHRCMMHNAQMYDAQCTNLWFCSMVLMMHESGEGYVYVMRYFLGTDGRTNEQGDSRSRMCMYSIQYIIHW